MPNKARYWVYTVEAMPQDIGAEFVAIDEIQLCGDPGGWYSGQGCDDKRPFVHRDWPHAKHPVQFQGVRHQSCRKGPME